MLLDVQNTVRFPGTEMIFEDHAYPEQLRHAAELGFACVNKEVAMVGEQTEYSACFPSIKHGRSFVFWQHEGSLDTAPQDQHGTPYYVASSKGAVLGNQLIQIANWETDGFRVYGLQNAKDGTDAIVKSQYLRSLGIPIEWIFGAARPSQLPLPIPEYPKHADSAVLLPTTEFMTRLCKGVDARLLDSCYRDGILAFEPMVTYRLQQSVLRIWDLDRRIQARGIYDTHPDSYVLALMQDLEPTLIRQGLIDLGQAGSIPRTEIRGILAEYFLNHFPLLLANTLSTFWDQGFRHNYLHGGNVSLAGEIVDSESITGPFPCSNLAEQRRRPSSIYEDYWTLRRHIVPGFQNLGIHLELDDEKYRYLGSAIQNTFRRNLSKDTLKALDS